MERYWDGGAWTEDVRSLAMAPPPSGPVIGRTSGGGWDWKWLFFSFKGRAHRAHYWAVNASLVVVVVIAAIFVVAAGESVGAGAATGDGDGLSGIVVLVFLAVYLVALWASIAVGVKRWHDRDKSGAWMFLILVPFGSLWVLVECGFLPGTDGPNQYGGDPRLASSTPY
jgi:uncharacterized membrane protein YhaH (DUF805 family)